VQSLTQLLVSAGAAESKVGEALQVIGKALEVKVGKQVSTQSVQRFILERGVRANIQLVYETIKAGSKCYFQG